MPKHEVECKRLLVSDRSVLMSIDSRTSVNTAAAKGVEGSVAALGPRERRLALPAVSEDSRLALDIRHLVERGEMDEARERFAGLVAAHQRRASRLAFQYLRDVSEADEAVQDAFVKVFSHITSYREAWPFEVWFTRILINGCLDRRKARARHARWFVPGDVSGAFDSLGSPGSAGINIMRRAAGTAALDPEHRLLARERREE